MEVVHFVGVLVGVVLVGRVEHEPLPRLEHRRQHVHVLPEGQLEVLRIYQGSLSELLVIRQSTQLA